MGLTALYFNSTDLEMREKESEREREDHNKNQTFFFSIWLQVLFIASAFFSQYSLLKNALELNYCKAVSDLNYSITGYLLCHRSIELSDFFTQSKCTYRVARFYQQWLSVTCNWAPKK
jgi:hypothetical protein